jgi:hypothetical protein
MNGADNGADEAIGVYSKPLGGFNCCPSLRGLGAGKDGSFGPA